MFFFDMVALRQRGDALQKSNSFDLSEHAVSLSAEAGILSFDVSERLNEVVVEMPQSVVREDLECALNRYLSLTSHNMTEVDVGRVWFSTLSFLRSRVLDF